MCVLTGIAAQDVMCFVFYKLHLFFRVSNERFVLYVYSHYVVIPINLYRNLLKLLNEINYWEQLMFETPHYVADLYQKKEDLRVLRENVLLVVRDYNRFDFCLYFCLYC